MKEQQLAKEQQRDFNVIKMQISWSEILHRFFVEERNLKVKQIWDFWKTD